MIYENDKLKLSLDTFVKIKWDILRYLVPFVQFKKHEKHPWRSATFRGFSLQIYQHFSMGVFHIFKIVQMQPNWATHHSYLALFMDTMNAREETFKT